MKTQAIITLAIKAQKRKKKLSYVADFDRTDSIPDVTMILRM